MNTNRFPDTASFFLIGISYQKTNAASRGLFAIDQQQYEICLKHAPAFGISALFILSTCNRTEVYGFAAHPSALGSLLCTATQGSSAAFTQLAYVKKGEEAVAHLFRVGAGLDSQLLGDYEIVGQLKQAVKVARDLGFINTFLDRLVSAVLQCSKCIKNNTAVSKGAVSVAYATIQYIKAAVKEPARQRILLLGTGDIGHAICKNLVNYLAAQTVILINRSEEKAAGIAQMLGLTHAPWTQLAEQVALADIVIVCTHAPKPLILNAHLQNTGHKLVIDLSVPCNVEAAVNQLPKIHLAGIDEISYLNDQALQARLTDVPKANAIIANYLDSFLEWCSMRKNIPVLKAIGIRLNEIAAQEQHRETGQTIRQVLGETANKMRADNHYGCHYIEAINELMSVSNLKSTA
jgi:glutamyl-tRNA reductase